MPTVYEQWVKAVGIPFYKGYSHDDLRTLELGRWEERQCNAAVIELAGQEGVSETRVIEIPPGKTLPPYRFPVDEVAYVLEGQGLTSVQRSGDPAWKTFEWQKHSLFVLPRHCYRRLGNAQGNRPARLLFTSALPLLMQATLDPDFFVQNSYVPAPSNESLEGLYSEARIVSNADGWRSEWHGNFFPDMRAWDKLDPFKGRGAGGKVVWIRFPNSAISAHMSVFPARTYKKAHRHGPGIVIVIPAGEGYSIMWEEGKEKVFVPWHEASVFVPPNRWFHQHFNLGNAPARYLALHPARVAQQQNTERVGNPSTDQIEYPNEDPWIRQKFEEELGKRGLTSAMPEEAYKVKGFEWKYAESKED